MRINPSRRMLMLGAMGLSMFGTVPARSGIMDLAVPIERLAEPMPPHAVTERSGKLRDGDPVHRGSGTARLLKLPDGGHVVRLENFQVVRGPNLLVYLVINDDPLFPEDVTANFQNLGPLKGLLGDQNYPVPSNVDVAAFGSVVVWCDDFKTQFAVASLS